MNEFDKKINQYFGGKVVRKDLTKLVKGNAIVPTYVLEYLLGQYCATDDEETIKQGVETVKSVIAKHFVHRDEAQLIKSTIRDQKSHRIIDKVSVKLNDRRDYYETSFANLGLHNVMINEYFVKQNPKLLSGGVWCLITMSYEASDDRNASPWIIENLKPIQISNVDVNEYKDIRKNFTRDEWVDLLIQSIGLNPEEFTFRSKLIQLARLVPFCENNYNLLELGPKGTGKSHIYSEMSPHGILISGGEVSKAKLFVNNSTGDIGLLGYWDVVSYDEFTGKNKKIEKGLVDILKNYLANKSFSRGTEIYGASASMAFVGNTDHSVPYMLKHSNLFEALPKDYYDTAFLDRLHCYLAGWEVQKLRNDMFTNNYGFIVDYLAEVLKELRKEDRMNDYTKYFELSETITTRDKTSIGKTFSGLMKVIFPHGEYTEEDARIILEFAIENRKRVKDQLRIMDETFEKVDFCYTNKATGKTTFIHTLEYLENKTSLGLPEEDPIDDPMVESEVEDKSQQSEKKAGQRIIRDNQTGISFEQLFGAYLENVKEITLTDPYIRLPYQLRNLMEFSKLIANKKNEADEVKFHLITNNNEEFIENSRDAFQEITDTLEPLGIIFTYEFDQDTHDRSITMDNGWKILLGRGLDIFQKTNGRFDIAEYYQEKRLCKACEVTYISTKE
jgi:ATP-dependent Lon protease